MPTTKDSLDLQFNTNLMSTTTPSTMQSALVHAGPRVEIISTEVPKPGPGQPLLKVHFAASNPKDWKRPTLMGQAPLNQGDDVSGAVQALGDNVKGFSIGDRVAGYHMPGSPFGTYAEYCIVEAWATWHLPDHMDMAEAATFPMASMTAAVALWRELGIPHPWARGQREGIIIYGAGSTVGLFGVKLAKLSGMSPIIAVAGNDASRKLVASLLDTGKGDSVVDYRQGEEATVEAIGAAVGSAKVRLALDAISSGATESLLGRVLDKSNGNTRIATVLPLNAEDETEGVTRSFTISPLIFGDVKEAGMPIGANRWLGATIIKFIEMAVADGSLKGHPYEIVEGGLHGVEKGLKLLQAGSVKGPVKYVYKVGA
jgi:NADPH2:quinone reductase